MNPTLAQILSRPSPLRARRPKRRETPLVCIASSSTEQGWEQFRNREYRLALCTFHKALHRDGGDCGAFLGLGWSAAYLGDSATSVLAFRAATLLAPEREFDFLRAALAVHRRGDTRTAIRLVEQTLQEDYHSPALRQAHHSAERQVVLAHLAFLREDFTGAEEHVAYAMEWHPDNRFLHGLLGAVLLHQGDREEEARQALLRATAKRSGTGTTWYYLGCAEALLGNRDAARGALQTAIQRDPGYLPAYRLLMQLEWKSGRWIAAAHCWLKQLRLHYLKRIFAS